ncbi:ATP-dependent sacrificial sulfur transferase LarE [Methanimicrococcus hongohii]|nr:ATP-dependent sacrificial sulfur transferase LarE [Methanimicrococcus sp. Hf6]
MTSMKMTIKDKEKALETFFKNHKKILIAFSGGADSSLLAAAGAAAAEHAADTDSIILAVTVKTELISDAEIENARSVADEIGISHLIIGKKMLNIPEIENNQKDRCYACKKELLTTLMEYAAENDYEAVLEGTNFSDKLMSDAGTVPRPGFSFILEQKEIQSKLSKANYSGPILITPLLDFEITKEDVREMLKRKKISTANKPSMSCLATRFSYETKLDPALLKTIDAAEKMTKEIGAKQIRIRVHTDSAGRNIARIEVGADEGKFFFDKKNQKAVSDMISFLKQNGFSYVTADLEGFRSGSMDI